MRLDTLVEVVRKELGVFFSSPIGYLFLAAFLGVTLFVFFWGEAFFARNISDVRPLFEWFPILLIFLAAALTMRIWSDERRTGTIEFIITLPATTLELVLGKFVACLILLVVALIVTLPLPILVSFLGDIDLGPVAAGYLATILLGSSYLSIGLFVSSRTDNQFVALIFTVFVCGVFYIFGSPFLTGLFSTEIASVLREFGAGSRFESITRGVLDVPDLYFYASVALTFLALNVHSLKSLGWASDGDSGQHRVANLTTAAICANLLIASIWMNSLNILRWDVTEGDQYSISEVTRQTLAQLDEPLLIRGYFSSKTHPLLAPLVPQMQDLLKEFEVAGSGRVRVEVFDPGDNPELEDEANSVYGIRPVEFSVSDRYQSSLVRSYFDILLKYADEYIVLTFRDLIEVKVVSESELDVKLRNPEFDLTRSIRKILAEFQGGGSTFDYIPGSIEFTGYLSDDSKLPEDLSQARKELENALSELEAESGGKFSSSIVDPEAGDGETARFIEENYGFQPQVASLFAENSFYYYLTLSDGQAVVSVALPQQLDTDGFKQHLGEGLKRFASGLLKGVELHVPLPKPANPQGYGQQPSPGPEFSELRNYLSSEFEVQSANLSAGVGSSSDVLLLLAPSGLSSSEVFAVDQFLMQGGTVIIAASAHSTELSQRSLMASLERTGLEEWLKHQGVTLEQSMVLDRQNAAFPLPTQRTVGGLTFREMRMFDYPYFPDVRGAGILPDHPANRDLGQVTFAWASPLTLDPDRTKDLDVAELFRSSAASWTEATPDVMPRITDTNELQWQSPSGLSSQLLGVALSGRFTSYFEDSPLIEAARAEAALAKDEEPDEPPKVEGASFEKVELEKEDKLGVVSGVISQSPESSRLIVLGSSEFLADQTLRLVSSVSGSLYTNSIQAVTNLVNWSMEDASLLSIRGRGHFNRTLIPLTENEQRLREYAVYGSVLLLLGLIFLVNWQLRSAQRARHARMLGGGS